MASKKFHNFVKSKVNVTSNITIPFAKPRLKCDSLEEPLIFDNLEKESSPEDVGETNYAVNSNNSNFENDAGDINTDGIRNCDDYELLVEPGEACNSGAINNPLRVGVERLGKSVNIAFKDAHLAINAIMKDSQKKKSVRKPSDVTKSRYKFSSFAKKRYSVLEENKLRSKSLSREEKLDEDKLEEISQHEDEITGESSAAKKDDEDNVTEMEFSNSSERQSLNFEPDSNEKSNINPNNDIVTAAIAKVQVQSNRNAVKPEISPILTDSVIEPVVSSVEHSNNTEITQPMNFTNLKLVGSVGAFLSLIFVFSISKFIIGLICGMLMSFGIFKIYESFFLINEDDEIQNRKCPKLRELPAPVIPHIEDHLILDEYASSKATFSTWINAVNSYHPSWYNLNASYSLHLSLEGTKMRMRTPKNKIPSRAMWNERKLSGIVFLNERTVDLLYARVHLLPYGLVRRRMWSKKYPICITINKGGQSKTHRSQLNMHHSKSYENLAEENSNEENFFFFTRTCREKEEMFRRLMAASLGMPINLTINDIIEKYLSKEVFSSYPIPLLNSKDEESNKQESSKDHSKEETSPVSKPGSSVKINKSTKEPQIVSYVRYMAKFMPSDTLLLKAKSQHIDLNYIQCDPELLWLNALFGRVAWDVFRGNHWCKVIREKIQKKLKKIHLPYFIDKLEVIDIDLGTELPVIRKVSRPYLDFKGLWVEFEMVYAGGFSMGLETKINLMKLKNVAAGQKGSHGKGKKGDFTVKYNPDTNFNQPDPIIETSETDPICDISLDNKLQMNMTTGGGAVGSEEVEEDKLPSNLSSDDSFESSTESDASIDKFQSETDSKSLNPTQGSSKSLMHWVDKIARSTYFQKAADNKYVQKTMEYVSNTSLALQVDAAYLNGTLVINIPPPPSDRLWWGFKKNPELQIKARPKVGQKEIQMTKIVEFIEKKLLQEFQRVVVLPNMDDIAIPLLLNGNPENYSQTLL